jgi:hypothetical protein
MFGTESLPSDCVNQIELRKVIERPAADLHTTLASSPTFGTIRRTDDDEVTLSP